MNLKNKSIGTMFLTMALLSGIVGAASLPSVFATIFLPDIDCYGVLNCIEGGAGEQGPPGNRTRRTKRR